MQIATLNPHAKMYTCINGIVPLTDVLAAAGGEGVAKLDEDGELKRLVNHLHSHGSEHGHAEKAADKPAEGHGHNHTGGTSDGGCTEGCTDESHEHGHHEHGHHEHGHHEHSHREGRETKRFGITSFCYERRRPFHPHRLMNVIRQLPVRQESLALSDALKDSPTPAASVSAAAGATASGTSAVADGGTDTSRSPMSTLIRAKGFIWLSNSHSQIFYWALAGKHFELSAYATWWAATAPEGWPQEPKENEEMQKDFSGEFGDRRQVGASGQYGARNLDVWEQGKSISGAKFVYALRSSPPHACMATHAHLPARPFCRKLSSLGSVWTAWPLKRCSMSASSRTMRLPCTGSTG